jgi:hypothetical protein
MQIPKVQRNPRITGTIRGLAIWTHSPECKNLGWQTLPRDPSSREFYLKQSPLRLLGITRCGFIKEDHHGEYHRNREGRNHRIQR